MSYLLLVFFSFQPFSKISVPFLSHAQPSYKKISKLAFKLSFYVFQKCITMPQTFHYLKYLEKAEGRGSRLNTLSPGLSSSLKFKVTHFSYR